MTHSPAQRSFKANVGQKIKPNLNWTATVEAAEKGGKKTIALVTQNSATNHLGRTIVVPTACRAQPIIR